MENLFDKLNPDIKTGLEQNKEKYALSVNTIIKTLKSKVVHGDLTIGELRDLATWSDTPMDNVDWKFGDNIYTS